MGTDFFTALDLLHGIIRRANADRADLAECAAAMTMLGMVRRIDYLGGVNQQRYEELLEAMRPLMADRLVDPAPRARWS